MRHVVAYVAAAVVFLGLDFAWLGFVAKSAYRVLDRRAHARRDPRHRRGALLSRLRRRPRDLRHRPALKDGAWQTAALYGALFGFFAYGTYELTNYATLKDWPLRHGRGRHGLGDGAQRRRRHRRLRRGAAPRLTRDRPSHDSPPATAAAAAGGGRGRRAGLSRFSRRTPAAPPPPARRRAPPAVGGSARSTLPIRRSACRRSPCAPPPRSPGAPGRRGRCS